MRSGELTEAPPPAGGHRERRARPHGADRAAATKLEARRRLGLRIELTPATLVHVAVVVGGIWLFVHVWPVVVVVGVALMLAGALGPPVAWLERHHLRRPLAIGVVFGAMALALAGFLLITVPSFVTQLADIVDRFPRLQEQAADGLARWKLTVPIAESVRGAQLSQLLGKAAAVGLTYSGRIVEIVAYAVTCFFLALYGMIDRDRLRGGVFSLVPRTFHVRLSRILASLGAIVGGYVRGQVITSVMMAVFTFAALSVARVPNALALAVFAGLTDVLPYVGGLLACGPAVVAAYGAHGWGAAAAVLAALAVYQEIESRVIVPRVYGHVLRLPSAVVIVALLVGGALMGMVGALLALPVAAAIRMVVEELRLELPGQPGVDPATRTLDAREERVFRRLAADVPAEEAAAIATEIVARLGADDPRDAPK